MSEIVLDTSGESEVYVALPSRTVWSNEMETKEKKSIKLIDKKAGLWKDKIDKL